jgi:uncharacterized LabA/DUF88 family protein
MTTQIQKTNMNAIVLVDLENIIELMKNYSANPMEELNFFPVIMDKFKNMDLNVIECICYANFERNSMKGSPQTALRKLGIETRQSSNNGKNSGDLEMTVDALRFLYKTSVEVFVLISSDRDIIPLIKAVKQENRLTYVLSTKNGFNPIVTRFADAHEFLEDIFNLTSENPVNCQADPAYQELENAEDAARLFFNSNILRRAEAEGTSITLKGFVSAASKILKRDPAQIKRDFELAEQAGLVILFNDPIKGVCIKGPDTGEPKK